MQPERRSNAALFFARMRTVRNRIGMRPSAGCAAVETTVF
jgi:hypothetical protein